MSSSHNFGQYLSPQALKTAPNHTLCTAITFILIYEQALHLSLFRGKAPDLKLATHMQITKTAKKRKNEKTLQRNCELATQKMVQGAPDAKGQNKSCLFFVAYAQLCCYCGLSSVQPHHTAAPSNAAWPYADASSGGAFPCLPQSYTLRSWCRWPPPAASQRPGGC